MNLCALPVYLRALLCCDLGGSGLPCVPSRTANRSGPPVTAAMVSESDDGESITVYVAASGTLATLTTSNCS